jgi:hypothetical protein
VQSIASFANVLKAGNLEVANIVKAGNLEVAGVICDQMKQANMEVVKCFTSGNEQPFKDLLDANIQLGLSKEKERLFSEQLAAACTENSRLSKHNMELTVGLEVVREQKRARTEEVDALNKKLNEQEVQFKTKINEQEVQFEKKLTKSLNTQDAYFKDLLDKEVQANIKKRDEQDIVWRKEVMQKEKQRQRDVESIRIVEKENNTLKVQLKRMEKNAEKLGVKVNLLKRGVKLDSENEDDSDN